MSYAKVFGAVFGFVVACAASAQGLSSVRGSLALSNASQASLAASGFLVTGSAEMIDASAQFTVQAVQAAGESAVIVLRGASEASTLSVLTSAALVGQASVAAGTIVQVVAEPIGHSLFVGGHLIAFLPNEIGRTLIHQSPHGAGWK
jgi:hypothetical protein